MAGLISRKAWPVPSTFSSTARGTWFDSIYISADATWDLNDAVFGRVQHSGDVAGGSSYSNSLTAALPGVLPGNYHVIIRSDILNNIVESNEANNIGASLDRVSIDATALTLGVAGYRFAHRWAI